MKDYFADEAHRERKSINGGSQGLAIPISERPWFDSPIRDLFRLHSRTSI